MFDQWLHSANAPGPDLGGDISALEEQVAHEKLRLIVDQARRVRWSILLLDLYIVWLMADIGQGWIAAVMVALHQAMHMWRWSIPRRYLARGGSALQTERHLEVVTSLTGVVRGLIAVPLFLQPVGITHYICTTVLVGQMAGATGSMVGLTRGFALWAAAMSVPTIIGWLLQGTSQTVPIGLLMVLLMAALVAVVREGAGTMHKVLSLRRQMESIAESLRHERDRAEEASRAKTRFFAAANHDLRQPLQALRYQVAQLQRWARSPPVNPKVVDLGETLAQSLDDSEKLLEGLLDISRLDAGSVPVRLRSLDVASVVEAVRMQFAAQAVAAGLDLETWVETTSADEKRATLWVNADRDHLLRILGNLVGNALKFTTAGQVRVRAGLEMGHVELSEAPAAGDVGDAAPRIVFSVEDTGPGIADEELPRIFEEFYQVGNQARDRHQGLGLGLSIVRRLVHRMEGTVSVQSTVGAGTTFRVLLPVATQPPSELQLPPTTAEGVAADALDARVLVVDDDPMLLRSLSGLLNDLGCDVRSAIDGTDAVAHVEAGFRPEILLLDHRLTEETGLEVLDRLRQRLDEVPAILLTGDTTPQLEQGADDGRFLVLHKPVSPSRLVALVRATIGVEREDHPRSSQP
ncbi:ATP-binding protein [Aquabacterium sp. J223]|uniref:ATP-binding response regulator n=1 Tax=Aquabacterium sp. J223 TaxID=2898431 RepID=UPI0021AD9996|nr:ATP-binding protein [Aquabacterium sp. J223]UUX95779.1 ATP-binding protein [Aquabacterium sp. J223]